MNLKNVYYFQNNTFIKANIEINQDQFLVNKSNEEKEPNYFLLPSFIDIHTHGGYGLDFNKLDDASEELIQTYIKKTKLEGVQKVMITTVTDSINHLKELALRINALIKEYDLFFGWHLEGPFINKNKCGAQDSKYIQPINEVFLIWLKEQKFNFPIMLTFAPEVKDNLMLANKYKDDFIFSIGHCACDYKTVLKTNALGINKYTHVFNAMYDMNHKYKQETILNAILNNNQSDCEIICDFKHVNKSSLQILSKLIDKNHVYLITDSLNCKGLKDGTYWLNELVIKKHDEVCYLQDEKTLAGSCAKFSTMVKNYFSIKNDMRKVILASSINQANFFHLNLMSNNFVLVDKDANLIAIYNNGKELENGNNFEI